MLKAKQNLLIRCLVAFCLQILSFIFKPFIFVELIYLLFLICWDKVENKIYYLFFMLPFYNVFRFSAGATTVNNLFSNFTSMYFSLILMICFCLVMFMHYVIDIKNKQKSLKIKNVILWLLFYITLVLPIRAFNLNTLTSFLVISGLFVALYLIVEYKHCWDLKTILDVWFCGILLSVFTYFLKWILPHLNEFLEQANVFFESEHRLSFLAQDPNYFAFELMTVLCGYTTLFFKKKIRRSYIVYFVVLSMIAILTLSKSFLISYFVLILILFICFIVHLIKKTKEGTFNKWLLIGIVSLILLIVVVAIFNIDKILSLLALSRKNVVDAESKSFYQLINSLTTGRMAIWLKYLKLTFSSFGVAILGRGALSGYEYLAVHNTTLQIVYFGGIIFFVMLLTLICLLVKYKKNQIGFANFITIIVLFVFSCSIDLLLSYRTYLILTICILCFSADCKKEEETLESRSRLSAEDFKDDIILSIVIPAYNAQKYLDKCVKSICEQNLIKTEVIIIDDGSTDNTAKIADRLAKKYDIVTVFHKENDGGGPSNARNLGLNKAKGKYIAYMDSDDYVVSNFTEIYNYLNEDADVIFTGYIAEYLKETKVVKYSSFKKYEGQEQVIKKCLEMRTNKNSPWCKIVKRELLIKNKLYFNKGFSEDYNWTGRLFCYANSVIEVPIQYYHYLAEVEGSQMNTYKKSKFISVIEHSKNILEEVKKAELNEKYVKKFKQFVGFNILSNFRFVKYLNKDEQKELYNELKNNYSLVKYQKPFIMKVFVLFAKIFGFEFAFKLARFI